MVHVRNWTLAATIFALPGALPAMTASEPDWFLSTGVGYTHPDSGRQADYGIGGSAGYAHRLSKNLWWEARVFANVFEPEATGTAASSQAGAGLELLVPFGAENSNQLLQILGAGRVRNDVTPNSLDDSGAYFTGAIAWRPAVRTDWSLRPRIETRAFVDSFDGGQMDAQLNLVLEFRTQATASVVHQPTPKAVVRIERIPTATPQATGPADADGDGVLDEDDRCPETLASAKVEADGCVWEEQVITLSNFRFELASDGLTSASRDQLDDVARFFLNQGDVVVDVYGHTDDLGSDDYNLKLSEDRARAVRAYLITRGIAPTRMTSKGFGESKPISSNSTDEGRARNRRVELHIHARQP